MASRGINGLAVGAIAVGGLFVYSGVRGTGILASVKSAIQGQPLSTDLQLNPITPADPAIPVSSEGGSTETTPTNSEGSAGKGGQIAADARQYDGAGYVFGGAPAIGIGHWDCSSFVNKIVGIDNGLAIPGYAAGKYDGKSHGPPSIVWFAWTGATTIGHDGSLAQPGDLCCWQTHIGIALGGGQMISARSASDHPPTGIQSIKGAIPGELLAVRRLKGI